MSIVIKKDHILSVQNYIRNLKLKVNTAINKGQACFRRLKKREEVEGGVC